MSDEPGRSGLNIDACLRAYSARASETSKDLPWQAVRVIVDRLHQARLCRANIFVAGNGGSAVAAFHFANELNQGANILGMPRFRAISLADNIPLLTAWSNGGGYVGALREALASLAQPDDLFIGISCSGNSANVVEAAVLARELGLYTISMTGNPGGKLAQMVDLPCVVTNDRIEQIKDIHMFLAHAMVSALRQKAADESVPVLLLANGRGATPEMPIWSSELARRPAVFVDRDGVINANRADYVKTWQEFELLPGSLDALRVLTRAGIPVVVVTNQSGVNRGVMRFEVADSINGRLLSLTTRAGAHLDAVCWCPHRPDENCGCRKPQTGMLDYAAASLGLDLKRSYLIGDAITDIQAGHDAGCRTALVLTGRGQKYRAEVGERYGQCQIVADLGQAVSWILKDMKTQIGCVTCRNDLPKVEK